MFEFTSGTYSFDCSNRAHSNAGLITFNSNYGGTLGVAFSTSGTDVNAGDPGWATGTLTPTDKGNYTEYSCTFNVQANSVLFDPARMVYAHVIDAVGASLAVVTLTQAAAPRPDYAALSNSYIVKPGADIWIPVSRANEHAPGAIGENDALTAAFLWADAPELLSELSAYGTGALGAIRVAAARGDDKAGNAVVAVKVGGVIKWSWHIWVTDYEPATTWMDRHLGATSGTKTDGVRTFGLLYQWGRKDPFPNSSATGEPVIYTALGDVIGAQYYVGKYKVTSQQTYAWSVANPRTFVSLGTDGLEYIYSPWYSGATATDNYWGYQGNKAIYDPCPAGYRVPVKEKESWEVSGFGSWDSTNKGREASAYGGWYPAAGFRHGRDGNLKEFEKETYVWGATTDGTNSASYLYFDSTVNINVSSGGSKSFGFSVRCKKE
jgi:hypothetical protein